ncbi:MAG: PIG-L deacetylase family protein [Acidimicrobiia bacterium]
MTVDTRVPQSALAVYAHPDDPEISAGGTLAKWAAAGAVVHVLVTTLGDKGSDDPNAEPAAVATMRATESDAAARVLGLAGHANLGFPDGELEDIEALRGAICQVVRELQPEVVLCPDPTSVFFGDRYINHRDHRVTGWATLDAISPAAASPHYFADQIAAGLSPHRVRAVYCSGTFEPNAWIDIASSLDTKIDALYEHRSQLVEAGEWFRTFLRDRAEEEGRPVGVRYAEAFRRVMLHD